MSWLHAGRVLVRGRAAPIVGSPSLEHTRIDLTSVTGAQVGDEVVIIGRQGEAEITAAEVADRQGLGLHHVATTVGPRVTRVYFAGGAPVKMVTPLNRGGRNDAQTFHRGGGSGRHHLHRMRSGGWSGRSAGADAAP
jgi:hypothetical protein